MKKLIVILSLLISTAAFADERILSFHSDVRVFSDGMIEVTETIQVRAEGNQIRRGIYRDFPVEYEDRLDNTYEISVEPLAVLRNEMPEPFHTVRNRRDVRTYFGSKNDELYWNVTGNRWAFPIDKASATVTLEFDAPHDSIMVEGYTGRLGSKAQEYSRYMDEAGAVHFSADNPLPSAHGITIVVGWPKGLVVEPAQLQRVGWLLSDNRNLLIAVIGLLLLLAYYVPVWRSHGKDPDEGVIITRYDPPKNFSPASLRYIRQMYYDDKVMTAAIVNLAVKGYLEIKKKGDTHSIKKVGTGTLRPALAAGEQELYTALFKEDSAMLVANTSVRLRPTTSRNIFAPMGH